MKKPNNYWTKDNCKKVALKYNSRMNFKKYDASAYTTSIKNKWLSDICSHMKYVNKYWNCDDCKIEALKYDNLTDFQRHSHGAYEFSKKHNFLYDICSHMKSYGNRFNRCVYVFEFEDNVAYVGLTYNIDIRYAEHKSKGVVYKHIIKNLNYTLTQLTNYIDCNKAKIIEEETIKYYKNNGWKLLNTNIKSSLGGNIIIWNYDNCKKEAAKYKFRTDFNKKIEVHQNLQEKINGRRIFVLIWNIKNLLDVGQRKINYFY